MPSFFDFRIPRIGLVFFTLFFTIGCDQVTKVVAIDMLKGLEPIHYLWGMFRLEYAENPGAFLGLGRSMPDELRFWIFTVAVGVAMAFTVYIVLRKPQKLFHTLALSLLAGGGISNFLDRAFRQEGHVIDFMNVGVGDLRTGIFNIADVAIMTGVIMIFLRPFIERMNEDDCASQGFRLQ